MASQVNLKEISYPYVNIYLKNWSRQNDSE